MFRSKLIKLSGALTERNSNSFVARLASQRHLYFTARNSLPDALAPAWYMLFATAVGLVAMMMMRETAPILTRPQWRSTSGLP